MDGLELLIAASLNAKLSFLGQVFGFQPAGDVPLLAIKNLPADTASPGARAR